MKVKLKRKVPQSAVPIKTNSGTALADRKPVGWRTANLGIIAVIAVVVFLCTVRLRLADVPLERDEGEYAYSGQLILEGFSPYQLAYNMKFPGTYYAYSAILAIFGQTAWGVHAGLLVANIATVVLLFLLTRCLLNDDKAAAVAAIVFGFLSLNRWILGIFGHATHFVVLFEVAGLLALCHALRSKSIIAFGSAGTLLGLSLLMKQNGIFFVILGVGIAAASEMGQPRRNMRQALIRSGVVAIGCAVPFVILCFVLLLQGTLQKFWFWTFKYAKEYASNVSLSDGWMLFTQSVREVTRGNVLIWILAAVGLILLYVVRWPRDTRTILGALAVTSLLAICPDFYFRNHYFILLLPAAGLLCGVAITSIDRCLRHITSAGSAHVISIAIFVFALGIYVVHEWDYLFVTPPIDLSRELYGSNPFAEAPQLAHYIQARTNASDRIAVLGSEPEIYFYSKRKSATGYIYMYPLMEQQKYSQGMQDEMMQEITKAHPKYVVYTGINASWLVRNTKEPVLSWSQAYLNTCYSLVGIVDIGSGANARWFWDADLPKYRPGSQNIIYTFKAKTDAPCGFGRK
jgi:4-amino-4-deoxy-L-arabinose transferase-like glycosyltransferase